MAKMRILVVDRESAIRGLARFSLDMVGGWEVLVAGSATEGVAKARAELPDVILLDAAMPDMDSLSVLQELLADEATRHIPVILLMEGVGPEGRENFAVPGVVGLISKDFYLVDLPDKIGEILGSHSRFSTS